MYKDILTKCFISSTEVKENVLLIGEIRDFKIRDVQITQDETDSTKCILNYTLIPIMPVEYIALNINIDNKPKEEVAFPTLREFLW